MQCQQVRLFHIDCRRSDLKEWIFSVLLEISHLIGSTVLMVAELPTLPKLFYGEERSHIQFSNI